MRGKRGVGFCKSMPGAVLPLEHIKKRRKPQPADPVFSKDHRQLFNTILAEENLKFDREGQRRTSYSLRHPYICLRLLEGADTRRPQADSIAARKLRSVAEMHMCEFLCWRSL